MCVPQFRRSLTGLFACCVLLLFTACDQGAPTGSNVTPTSTPGHATPVQTQAATVAPQSTATTIAMPQTQTDCPQPTTSAPLYPSRAMVTEPLALGTHQNLVYFVDENMSGQTTEASTLKRYDVVTGAKSDILRLSGASVNQVQVSADGQWLLFVTITPPSAVEKLQVVRMDGQGLQTLYCDVFLSGLQWSTNQKDIVFNSSGGMSLLDTVTGSLTTLFNTQVRVGAPFTWLDNTHFYISDSKSLLEWVDINKGANQTANALVVVYSDQRTGNYPCWNADSSYDGATLFVAQCNGSVAHNLSGSGLGTRVGPSSIRTESATGGTLQTIFTSATLGIKTVRAISQTKLLLVVENVSDTGTVDTSQNGLWRLNTDGSGLTRLTMTKTGETTSLNSSSQTPWANVSRDGSMYALVSASQTSTGGTAALQSGTLNAGISTLTTIDSVVSSTSSLNQDGIAGWTTM